MVGQPPSVLLAVALVVALAAGVLLLRGIDRDGDERADGGTEETNPQGGDGSRTPVFEAPAVRESNGRITCKHCGKRNDPGYTYCRRCVTRL